MAIGQRRPAIVPMPFDNPINILAYLGAISERILFFEKNIKFNGFKNFKFIYYLNDSRCSPI